MYVCVHEWYDKADGTRRYYAVPGKEEETFAEAQRQRRQRMVDEYLASIASPVLRTKVIAACAQDFADLNIVVTD